MSDKKIIINIVKNKLKKDNIDIKQEVIKNCTEKSLNNISYDLDQSHIKPKTIAEGVISAIKIAHKNNLTDDDQYMDSNIEVNKLPDISDIDNYK